LKRQELSRQCARIQQRAAAASSIQRALADFFLGKPTIFLRGNSKQPLSGTPQCGLLVFTNPSRRILSPDLIVWLLFDHLNTIKSTIIGGAES
jgi:hypothetical protein